MAFIFAFYSTFLKNQSSKTPTLPENQFKKSTFFFLKFPTPFFFKYFSKNLFL